MTIKQEKLFWSGTTFSVEHVSLQRPCLFDVDLDRELREKIRSNFVYTNGNYLCLKVTICCWLSAGNCYEWISNRLTNNYSSVKLMSLWCPILVLCNQLSLLKSRQKHLVMDQKHIIRKLKTILYTCLIIDTSEALLWSDVQKSHHFSFFLTSEVVLLKNGFNWKAFKEQLQKKFRAFVALSFGSW